MQKTPWLLPRVWSVFVLLLITVTYRLWLLPAGQTAFPQIPLLGRSIELSGWVSIIPTVSLVLGLLLVIAKPHRFRPLWWLVAASFLCCFLVDQHRLQPWAYQSAIYAVVFASMDQHRARRWLIPLAASVYMYSAAGKLDFQFAHTVGQDFLSAVAWPLGGLPDEWNESLRAKLALVFPAVEFLAGAGLLFRVTRPVAAGAVILMHCALIGILGPWGLDHSMGVLVWNVLLIVQAYLLMLKPEFTLPAMTGQRLTSGKGKSELSSSEQPRRDVSLTARFAQLLVVAAIGAPLLERSGYWDHWTSWSLYSPHTSRTRIEIHRSAVDSLDPAARPFLLSDADGDGWQELALNQWSLESLGVAIYPQARYQLALAARIAAENEFSDDIRVRVSSVSDRWTGQRQERLLLGRDEIEKGLGFFWLSR